MDFGGGFLGAEANDDNRQERKHKARHKFVNLEDFSGESGEVELPDKRRNATDEHTGNGPRERRALPEESEEHDRAKRCTEAAPGEAHEAHHHVQEALALLNAIGTRGALHSDNHSDKRNEYDDAAAHPHHFLVACVLAEQVLVKVVTESGSGHQKLGVCGTHNSGENGCHEDGGNRRMAKGLAEDHEDAFRVIDLDAMGFNVVAAEKGNHDGGTEADGDPGHGDTAGEFDVFGVLDAHEAHQNVRHAEVAETPGEARNKGDKADRLARRGVREEAHQVGVLCIHGIHGGCKSAGTGHDHRRNHDDGDKHHQGLDKVGPAHSKEASHKSVAHDHDSTEDKTRSVIHAENRAEEFCASHKARNRVEQEEGENEDGGDNADDSLLVAEAVREEIRERNGVTAEVAVLAEPAAHDFPVEVRANDKADTDPGFRKATHENGTREAHQEPAAHIRGLGRHGDHPLIHAAVAEVVGVQAIGFAREIRSNAKHHQQIKNKDSNCHEYSLVYL